MHHLTLLCRPPSWIFGEKMGRGKKGRERKGNSGEGREWEGPNNFSSPPLVSQRSRNRFRPA